MHIEYKIPHVELIVFQEFRNARVEDRLVDIS